MVVSTKARKHCGVPGRPLYDGNRCVLPDVIPADLLDATVSAHDERVRAGAHWLESARRKYASVAAFSRQSAELMAFAAPAALVRRSHDAALDEVRHAQLCLDVARELLDVPVELGRLTIVPARGDLSLSDLAVECFVEGCIGEAVAAARALHAAEDSTREIGRILSAIADDELRHAALSWSVVGWAMHEDVRVTPALLAAAAAWHGEARRRPDPSSRQSLDAFGVLDPASARRIADAVVDEIVVPGLHKLVADREASAALRS